MRGMIARIFARISSIILWPLTFLARRVTKANRRTIRWAIRKRYGAAYLAVIFWFPALTLAGLIWALVSVRVKPSDLGPTLAVVSVIFVFAQKLLAIVHYLVVVQGDRTIKALRHYRRHFR
jgi:hypothetical protein